MNILLPVLENKFRCTWKLQNWQEFLLLTVVGGLSCLKILKKITTNVVHFYFQDDISLMLVDLKSKYGTFYNNERVQPEIEINIVGETTIKFGQINSTFR